MCSFTVIFYQIAASLIDVFTSIELADADIYERGVLSVSFFDDDAKRRFSELNALPSFLQLPPMTWQTLVPSIVCVRVIVDLSDNIVANMLSRLQSSTLCDQIVLFDRNGRSDASALQTNANKWSKLTLLLRRSQWQTNRERDMNIVFKWVHL